MNKRILLSALGIFLWQAALTQTVLKDPTAITNHADAVMVHLEKKQFTEAFALLKLHWPTPGELDELEAETTKEFDVAEAQFGKIIGKAFFKDQHIKDFVIRKIYILRFEKHLIRVLFTYYRNDERWILNGFKWDDGMDELLKLAE